MNSTKIEERALPIVLKIVDTTAKESLDTDGGQFYESSTIKGLNDTDKHWWPQAETVVGFLNAWQLTGKDDYFNQAQKTWDFIEKYIVDKKGGEWLWKVSKDRTPDETQDRAGFWKCPYHNSRACFEIMDRIKV